jgi:hypothetical protein
VRRLGILILTLSLFLVASVFAQQNGGGNTVIPESIFVRSQPDINSIPIGSLSAGAVVRPLNISPDGEWVLIVYRRNYGWIQRSLVAWENDASISVLPTLLPGVVPTSIFAPTETPFLPTFTPDGSYVLVTDANSAFVRAGPGRGYLRIGDLLPGDVVEPVARNFDTTWIMIRYINPRIEFDGFGWIGRSLVRWENPQALEELPVVFEENLTPTATFTNSPTTTATLSATPSATLTLTVTASVTPKPTETNTTEPTSTNTTAPTATNTAEPIATNTPQPTSTNTAEPTATDTPQPTSTNTAEPTATDTPQPTSTNTSEPTATDTPQPTSTNTTEPTSTNTAEPTVTNTSAPTATDTAQVVAIVNTNTAEPTATNTDQPTETHTPEPSTTPTTTSELTEVVVAQATIEFTEAVIILPSTPVPTLNTENVSETPNISIEAIIAGIVLLVLLIYAVIYAFASAALGAYKDGFVIDTCPVCKRGQLTVESKVERVLGIPVARHTVRCDTCRSVLRGNGRKRWRYAVDRLENPVLFERLNGRDITDDELVELSKRPFSNQQKPTFENDK